MWRNIYYSVFFFFRALPSIYLFQSQTVKYPLGIFLNKQTINAQRNCFPARPTGSTSSQLWKVKCFPFPSLEVRTTSSSLFITAYINISPQQQALVLHTKKKIFKAGRCLDIIQPTPSLLQVRQERGSRAQPWKQWPSNPGWVINWLEPVEDLTSNGSWASL